MPNPKQSPIPSPKHSIVVDAALHQGDHAAHDRQGEEAAERVHEDAQVDLGSCACAGRRAAAARCPARRKWGRGACTRCRAPRTPAPQTPLGAPGSPTRTWTFPSSYSTGPSGMYGCGVQVAQRPQRPLAVAVQPFQNPTRIPVVSSAACCAFSVLRMRWSSGWPRRLGRRQHLAAELTHQPHGAAAHPRVDDRQVGARHGTPEHLRQPPEASCSVPSGAPAKHEAIHGVALRVVLRLEARSGRRDHRVVAVEHRARGSAVLGASWSTAALPGPSTSRSGRAPRGRSHTSRRLLQRVQEALVVRGHGERPHLPL